MLDELIIWDTAYFCPPVGANLVASSSCCTEPNVLDSKRKPFYKDEAKRMSFTYCQVAVSGHGQLECLCPQATVGKAFTWAQCFRGFPF